MKNKKILGILCIILSAFFFACMNMFVRMSGDLPVIQKSFFRNLVAAIFALGVVVKQKQKIDINKNNIFPLLVRSTAGTIGIFCNYYAVDHLAIADASMLNKLSPFFALIFSYLILSEKFSLKQAICIIIAFIGSLFVIKPSMNLFSNPSSLIGMMGGLTAGLAYTFVRICSKKGTPGPTIVLFFSTFSCLVCLPMFIFNPAPMTLQQLLSLLAAGLCGAGGQFSITAAYSYAPAKEISIYDYSQIIFSTILGLVFLHELPDTYSFIGYVIIIFASLMMFIMSNRQKGINES